MGLVDRSGLRHRRWGVGYYTDTQERAWFPLSGVKQSVYRAAFLAAVCGGFCQQSLPLFACCGSDFALRRHYQLRVRPNSEPHVPLRTTEVPAEDPADTGIIGMVFPFQTGPHLRVVRYASGLLQLQLKKKKVEVRPVCLAPEARRTGLDGAPTNGDTIGASSSSSFQLLASGRTGSSNQLSLKSVR
eukprot:6082636-Amphidinium_carterae.1